MWNDKDDTLCTRDLRCGKERAQQHFHRSTSIFSMRNGSDSVIRKSIKLFSPYFSTWNVSEWEHIDSQFDARSNGMDRQENDAQSGSEWVKASIADSRLVDVGICELSSLSSTQPVRETFWSEEYMLFIDDNDEMEDKSWEQREATEDMACDSKSSFHANDSLPLSNANMSERTGGDAAAGPVAQEYPKKDSLKSSQISVWFLINRDIPSGRPTLYRQLFRHRSPTLGKIPSSRSCILRQWRNSCRRARTMHMDGRNHHPVAIDAKPLEVLYGMWNNLRDPIIDLLIEIQNTSWIRKGWFQCQPR